MLIKEELKREKEIVIERAHRTGKSKENKHRTIIAKILNYKDKSIILDEAKNKKLSRKNIYVNEDFSEITMKQRKDLAATVKRIRDNGDYAVIRYNKLITTQPRNWVNRKKEIQHEGIEVHD